MKMNEYIYLKEIIKYFCGHELNLPGSCKLIMNQQVTKKGWNFLTKRVTLSFPKRTVLRSVMHTNTNQAHLDASTFQMAVK